MANNMVEKVAAAISIAALDTLPPYVSAALARAAIEAMREPTDDIEDAARGLWLFYAGRPQSGYSLGRHNKAAGYGLSLTEEEAALEHVPKHVCGRIAWRTMIDAALQANAVSGSSNTPKGETE